MFFDELDHDYAPEAIAHATQIASDVELTVDGSLHSYGEALTKRGQTELESDRDAGQLVIVDGLVCQLWLGDEQSVARWGGVALGPMMEFAGQGVFPPYISAFPESVLPYLDARAAGTTLADARARYHDFLWLRRHSFPDAGAALAAYITAGTGADPAEPTDIMLAAEQLARAAQLSGSLNIDREGTARAILAEMSRVLPSDATGFGWRLARSAARLLAAAPAEARAFLAGVVLEAVAGATTDRHRERSLYEVAEPLAAELGDQSTAQAVRQAIAASWEAEADEPNGDGMQELAVVDEAIRAYHRIGDGAAVQRLKNRFADVAARVAVELPTHGFEFSISNEEFDRDVEKLRAWLSEKRFPFLGLPRFFRVLRPWDEVRAEFEEAKSKTPLQWLATRIHVEPDGRIVIPPEDEAEREQAYVLDHFTMSQQLGAAVSLMLIARVRETGEWSSDALLAAIGEVDPTMAAACDSGIRAFEAADYWTACHVLVPQVERGFRQIARMTSANIRRLVLEQGIEMASLNTLFEDDELVRFLGSDLTKSMAALFTEPRGLNIRNTTAHGLLEPSDDHKVRAFFAVMGVLTASWILALIRDHQADPPPVSSRPPSDPNLVPGGSYPPGLV
jgi:hypothetical protein